MHQLSSTKNDNYFFLNLTNSSKKKISPSISPAGLSVPTTPTTEALAATVPSTAEAEPMALPSGKPLRPSTEVPAAPAAAQAATDTPAAPTALAPLAALFARRSSSGAGRCRAPRAKATSAAKCWQLQPEDLFKIRTLLWETYRSLQNQPPSHLQLDPEYL